MARVVHFEILADEWAGGKKVQWSQRDPEDWDARLRMDIEGNMFGVLQPAPTP